jgi:hypothetical protein
LNLPKRDIELDDDDKRFIKRFELEPIIDLDEMKGWNGYIDTKGNFYRTKPIGVLYYNSSANVHDDWGEAFMLRHGYNSSDLPREVKIGTETERIYGGKDWLVHGEAWISCTFGSEFISLSETICIMYKGYDTRNINSAQKNTLLQLFQINNLPMECYKKILEDSEV